MATLYEYTWKHNITITSSSQLTFSRPLAEGSQFANLRTGETYRVLAVFKARENDRHNSMMPEDVVQTWSASHLSEQELADLRRK